MITTHQLQYEYAKLYEQLRKYLWPVHIVEDIAELEISCFTTFPNIHSICNQLNSLYAYVKNINNCTDDLTKQFRRFIDIVNSADSVYFKLTSPKEILSYESK